MRWIAPTKSGIVATGLMLAPIVMLASAATLAAPTALAAPNALPSAPRAEHAIPRWRTRAVRAQRAADRRAGRVGWAVVDHRGRLVAGWRVHRPFQSASVFKSMLLVCYLQDARVRARELTRAERDRLRAMITASADQPANWLYVTVDHHCLHRLARNAGIVGFHTEPRWGRTQITPYGVANLFFRIDRHIPQRHRAQAMRWLRGVVPSQRWGLARRSIVPRGMTIAFKGGFARTWGGGGHNISQGALFTAPNGHRLGVAVLTNHSPTAHYGHETIERIGAPLLRGYDPAPAVPRFAPRPRR